MSINDRLSLKSSLLEVDIVATSTILNLKGNGKIMNNKHTLAEKETQFAQIIWQNAPLSSKELTEICQVELNWKRTTTYTVLKKLCEKGIFKNENGEVTVVVNKEDFFAKQGSEIIKKGFLGSLPKFIVSFAKSNKLTDEDIEELQNLIDQHKNQEVGD